MAGNRTGYFSKITSLFSEKHGAPCCVKYRNVDRQCLVVEPHFNYHMASDVIPEYNYIEAKEVPKLPITLSDSFRKNTPRVFTKTNESFLPPPDDYTITAARREIPYMIATEYKNGHYNTTFTWESIERVLRSIERFKAVKYKRVTKGARLTFLQTNRDLGKNIAAVATKSKGLIRINPTFNFARNLAYCDRVCFHENFHLTGSSNHTNPGDPRPLMHMYGGNLDTLLPIDETYITVYPWVSGERFSTTPNLLSSLASIDPEMFSEMPTAISAKHTGNNTTSQDRVVCGIEWSWRDMLVYP